MSAPYGYKIGSGVMHKSLNINATIVEFRTGKGIATPAEIEQLVPDLYVCVKDTKGDLLGWDFESLADFPRTTNDNTPPAAQGAPSTIDKREHETALEAAYREYTAKLEQENGDLHVQIADILKQKDGISKELTRLTAEIAALKAEQSRIGITDNHGNAASLSAPAAPPSETIDANHWGCGRCGQAIPRAVSSAEHATVCPGPKVSEQPAPAAKGVRLSVAQVEALEIAVEAAEQQQRIYDNETMRGIVYGSNRNYIHSFSPSVDSHNVIIATARALVKRGLFDCLDEQYKRYAITDAGRAALAAAQQKESEAK